MLIIIGIAIIITILSLRNALISRVITLLHEDARELAVRSGPTDTQTDRQTGQRLSSHYYRIPCQNSVKVVP